MPITKDKPAPYAPAKVIIDLMSRFRSRGLPAPVDGEVLERAGVAQSLVPRTIQSLQTLDLIDEKLVPTATFEKLRLAPEAEYQARQVEWLKSAYADIFAFVDPSKDSETNIRDAFRSYQPVGQQGRMVILFQGLCAAAGLLPSPGGRLRTANDMPKPAKSSVRPRSKKDPTEAALRAIQEALNISEASGPVPMMAANVMASAAPPSSYYSQSLSFLPPALAGLMESLPREGWTQKSRDQFVKSFEAVLDFSIPIRDDHETKEDGREVTVLHRQS